MVRMVATDVLRKADNFPMVGLALSVYSTLHQ